MYRTRRRSRRVQRRAPRARRRSPDGIGVSWTSPRNCPDEAVIPRGTANRGTLGETASRVATRGWRVETVHTALWRPRPPVHNRERASVSRAPRTPRRNSLPIRVPPRRRRRPGIPGYVSDSRSRTYPQYCMRPNCSTRRFSDGTRRTPVSPPDHRGPSRRRDPPEAPPSVRRAARETSRAGNVTRAVSLR